MQLSSSDSLAIVLASTVASTLINWLLHGVLTVQLYLYYLAFPNDRTWTKVAVYTVYILETIQVIGLGTTLLLTIVRGSSSADARCLEDPWTSHEYECFTQSFLIISIGALAPLIAQCVYAHQIQLITQGKVIPCIIVALSTLQVLAAISLIVTFAKSLPSSIVVMVLWGVINVVNDTIIAFIMVQSLSKERPLSRYTRSKVTRLVRLIIATGLLTIISNIMAIGLVFIDAYIIGAWISTTGIGTFITKLYANSVLVLLNNRMTVRNSRDVSSNITLSNELSTLIIADREIESTVLHDETSLSTLTTRPKV